MSNEMNSLPILYKHLKLPFFSFTKIKIIKLPNGGHVPLMANNSQKKIIFETLHIVIEHLVLVTL
jgi:hypothetical protein